jgi:tetratricopeptide (TPR) repeat protein
MRVFWLLVMAAVPLLADSPAESVAVLPFWNAAVKPSASMDWIGESIAETIRDAMGSRGVGAIERDDTEDAFHHLGLRERTPISEGSIIKLGEELDAEQIVYGTFEFAASSTPATGTGAHGSLKISARILDLKRLKLSPAFDETGAVEDLATLQAHLAWKTLEMVAPKLAPPESEFRTVRAAVRLDAEESYVRGVLARDPAQKEQLFLQAARLDARFAHPCYQLGRMHYQRREYRAAADWLAKVGPEDFHFREAQFLLGLSLYESGEFGGAQKAFQTIVAAVPLNEVFNDLGAAESRKNMPQAIEDFRKAADGDPNDTDYRFNLGYALFKKGDFAGAAEQFRAVLAIRPEDSIADLLAARCAKKQGINPAVDLRLIGLERLKTNYEERAYWQLKNMLEPKAP